MTISVLNLHQMMIFRAHVEFFIYHFRQAVLANMKATMKVTIYDYEPTDDAQSMSVFVTGEGKEYF